MEAIQGYMEKMGSNFSVASMIPSLAFIAASMIVFEHDIHLSMVYQNEEGIYKLLGFSLLLFIPTIIVGYTLTALNTYIIKFYEGYVFLHRFTFVKRNQQKKAKKMQLQLKFLKKRIDKEDRKKKTKKSFNYLSSLKKQYYTIAADYDQNFPSDNEKILPTTFGNILRASEDYSATRYGIDSVNMWPRLLRVIPSSYQVAMEEANNELSFLLNISVLSFLLFILCMIAVLLNLVPQSLFGSIDISSPSYPQIYIFSGFMALMISWIFQKASLYSVGAYGNMIRSAYDLFRLDLLRKIRLKLPKDSVDEYHLWKNVDEFMKLGNLSLEFEPFVYDLEKRKEK